MAVLQCRLFIQESPHPFGLGDIRVADRDGLLMRGGDVETSIYVTSNATHATSSEQLIVGDEAGSSTA